MVTTFGSVYGARANPMAREPTLPLVNCPAADSGPWSGTPPLGEADRRIGPPSPPARRPLPSRPYPASSPTGYLERTYRLVSAAG